MSRAQIETLKLVGIRPDMLGTEVESTTWRLATNMVVKENHMERIGGHENLFGDPIEAPRFVIPVIGNVSYWVYIGATKVCVTDGNSHFDITPAGGIPDSYKWTWTFINGFPVFNDPGRVPFYWDGLTANVCVDLPNWPSAATRVNAIVAYGTYLFGLGVSDGAGDRPNELIWSDEAPSGQVPPTWIPDTTNDAGGVSLGQGQGGLVDGQILRDRLIVYKTFSAYEVTFIGGNLVFGVRLLYEDVGVMSQNCIATISNRQFVMTTSNIQMHDGTSPPVSISDEFVRNAYVDNFDSDYIDFSYVVNNHPDDEIWFCYPQKGTSGVLVALIYNWQKQKWGARQILYHHVNIGAYEPAEVGFTWETVVGTWETIEERWNSNVTGGGELQLVGAGVTHLQGIDHVETFSGSDVLGTLQTGGLHFGEINRMKLVTAVYPRVTGLAGEEIQIRIGAQNEVDGGIRWGGYETFTIGVDEKVDADIMGRYIAIEIRKLGGSRFRVESIDFEIQYRGYH